MKLNPNSIHYTKLKKLGSYRNNWRERTVTLYEHPSNPALVVTVGVGFHDGSEVVCEESRDSYPRQLRDNDWSTFL